jgi:hypothetical protein
MYFSFDKEFYKTRKKERMKERRKEDVQEMDEKNLNRQRKEGK